jgi:hypothetical protein
MKNKLFRCTFTGVDEFSSLEKIESISRMYPLVEWGVLLSTSENRALNGNRYPSVAWLENNLPKLFQIGEKTKASIALHVCGKETKLLLEQNESSVALNLISFVNRIQINFSYKEKQVNQLEILCAKYPNISFITQHNESNKDLYKKINAKNHQVLFDTSGGRGVKCEEWNSSLENKICGYAGGLGLEGISEDLSKIKEVAFNDFWIDMEGKIRTEDKLNLEFCEKILEILS